MKFKFLIGTIAISIFLTNCKSTNENVSLLIRGGTIINTEFNGTTDKDITKGYILIKDGIIQQWGEWSDTVVIPADCIVYDASGKYIMPGLIDGFAVINNQQYADAFLKAGVTSVIGLSSARRGDLFRDGDPSPRIYELRSVGDTVLSYKDIDDQFRQASIDSIKIALLMYKLTPDQVDRAVKLATTYNIGTIGEFGYTSYKEATEIGVDAFVHTTRYSLDIAPSSLRSAVAEEPFSNDLESAKWEYYRYLTNIDLSDNSLLNHSAILSDSESYIMPTLSLLYIDLPDHLNPWEDEISELLDENDIDNPADRVTGNHNYPEEIQQAYTNLAVKELLIESVYASSGARYLAGSATDVWGTMPGISLHTELELLKRIGLSNREILAAATSNFVDAFGWMSGSIKKGYHADILILNSNPLDNIKNLRDIDALFLNGEQLIINDTIE